MRQLWVQYLLYFFIKVTLTLTAYALCAAGLQRLCRDPCVTLCVAGHTAVRRFSLHLTSATLQGFQTAGQKDTTAWLSLRSMHLQAVLKG